MNIAKLKDQARKFELKDQFEKAIKIYRKILDELEGTPELEDELALFNKVGDLYLKKKDTNSAVDMYEQAAEHYRTSGFPNNAIALYNKVLRSAPSRTNAYLRLGELMIGRGFAAEAKNNFVVYLDRMEKENKLDQAFAALRTIADNAEDNEEIRLMLAGHLMDAARTDEARAQLSTLYSEAQTHGDDRRSRATLERMQAIDPDFNPGGASKTSGAPRKKKQADIVFLDLESGEEEVLAPVDDVERIEDAAAEDIVVEDTVADEAEVVVDVTDEDLLGEGVAAAVTGADDGVPEEYDFTPHAADGADLDIELAGGGESAFGDEDLITQTTFDEGAGTAELDDDLGAIEEPVDGGESESDSLGLVSDMTLDLRTSSTGILSLGLGDDIPLLDTDLDEKQDLVFESTTDEGSGLDLDYSGSDRGVGEDAELELDEIGLDRPSETLEELLLDVPDDDSPQELVLDDSHMGEPFDELVFEEKAGQTIPEFEDAVAADPTNSDLRYDLAEALVEAGETERAVVEFDAVISILDGRGDSARAVKVLTAVLRLDSNSTAHHRRRVEILSRLGDKQELVAAYLAYADALLRGGDMTGARNAYLNVLEHDAANEEARTALDTVVPEEPAEAAAGPVGGGDFVDLGQLIFGDDEVQMDTRMKTDSTKQSGDEDADFQEMLGQFKKGIEANIDESDAEAHYDLGVAFKEMGLLDEAISEFQKALRGADSRLKASESLGTCFFEKGQFPVAGTVLRRAIEADPGSDERKIGLLYWLGRCEEELGHPAEALSHYQRVFAVDIKFRDVNARVTGLA